MRGKEGTSGVVDLGTGITPAYAGKRRCRLRSKCRQQDHPRLCGEKVVSVRRLISDIRITPAYAGKRIKEGGKEMAF